MGALVQLQVQLSSIDCGVCGGVYAITETHRSYCQQHGKAWTCPYCKTGWGFADKGEVQRLQKELDAERARKQAALERANTAEINLAQAVRKHAREKNRIANGTCPCCRRSFVQLARHMANQHPEYNK